MSAPLPNATKAIGPNCIVSGKGHRRARLFLLGPLTLVDADGKICTPKGKKVQGLLALLALAPRGTRTRVWLCDKLWSRSDAKNAANCLRQTVFELKRDLGALVDGVLRSDRISVGLNLDRLRVDIHEIGNDQDKPYLQKTGAGTELLEGMDIADEEFEDWLMMERQVWLDRLERLRTDKAPTAPAAVTETNGQEGSTRADRMDGGRYSLGLLPNIQHGCDADTADLAEFIVDGIARNLREMQPLAIFDYRETGLHSDRFLNSCETEFFIRVRTLHVRDSLSLTLFAYRAATMGLEWSHSINLPVGDLPDDDALILHGFVAQSVDRLAKSLFTAPRGEEEPPDATVHKAVYSALNLMFKLDTEALENSAAILDAAERAAPNSLCPALRSYLASFKVGENLGSLDLDNAKATRALANSVVAENPFNAVSLACLGHVLGYVFGEHECAQDLFERALNLNPAQSFVWDHYALHNIYTGDYDTAYAAAKKAAYLGSYSPISYSYDTTLCMAATMAGDHGTAIVAGRRAMQKQPRFTAAMRYLMASYAMKGRPQEAEEIAAALLKVDPEFADPEVQKARFRLKDKAGEKCLLTAISQPMRV